MGLVPSFVFTDFEGYFEEPIKLVADPTECQEVAPSNDSQLEPLQSIHNELQRKEAVSEGVWPLHFDILCQDPDMP